MSHAGAVTTRPLDVPSSTPALPFPVRQEPTQGQALDALVAPGGPQAFPLMVIGAPQAAPLAPPGQPVDPRTAELEAAKSQASLCAVSSLLTATLLVSAVPGALAGGLAGALNGGGVMGTLVGAATGYIDACVTIPSTAVRAGGAAVSHAAEYARLTASAVLARANSAIAGS